MFGSFLNLFLLILHIGQTGSFPPPLSEKEEKELVEKMLKGDDSARSKLIEHNMRTSLKNTTRLRKTRTTLFR